MTIEPKNIKYGYCRVSTADQTTTTQADTLRKMGVEIIVEETKSGIRTRKGLNELLERLQPGDELWVTRLDRLARSARELDAIATALQEKQVTLGFNGQRYDPTDPMGKLMFQMLSMFAEFERNMIALRTSERLSAIKATGGKVGRKRSTDAKQEAMVIEFHKAGFTLAEIREATKLSSQVLKRVLTEHRDAVEDANDPTIARTRDELQVAADRDRAKALKKAAAQYAAYTPSKEKGNE